VVEFIDEDEIVGICPCRIEFYDLLVDLVDEVDLRLLLDRILLFLQLFLQTVG
jgi:hypothetical protein